MDAAIGAPPTAITGEPVPRVDAVIATAVQCLRASGIEEARHEALLLFAHAAGRSRAALLAHPERHVEPAEAARYAALVSRRATREPFAYVVGEREFYGRSFFVDRRVLIPRPETETLVEAALAILRQRTEPTRPLVVDVGTGSGAIALSIAAEALGARVIACDVSAAALAVAGRNRDRLGLAAWVPLVHGDLLSWLGCPADLVLANLPYLPAGRLSELMPEVGRYEPHLALFAGSDGVALIRRLLDDARRSIRSGGSLLLELDPEQVALVRVAAPWGRISVLRDLFDDDRVVRVDVP